MRRQSMRRWRRKGEPVQPDWPEIVVAWADTVRIDVEESARHSETLDRAGIAPFAERAADLLETLDVHPESSWTALERFGREIGSLGWPLEALTRWLDELVAIAPRHRDLLAGFRAGTSVARGWANGFVRGAHEQNVIDPLTGLCTPEMLETRIRQVYDQCRSLDVPARLAFALGVVDGGRPDLLSSNATAAVLGHIVSSTFCSGETSAALDGRIVVLAPSTPRLTLQLDRVREMAALDSTLRHLSVVTWVEQLPDEVDLVPSYLVDLSR